MGLVIFEKIGFYKRKFPTLFKIFLSIGVLNLFMTAGWAAPLPFFASVSGSGTACSQSVPCTLSQAVTSAADGQYVYIAGGTYTAAVDPMLTINKDLRLFGGWDGAGSGSVNLDPVAHPTILDGEDTRRVIEITDMATPILDGLTITRGYTLVKGGGIYIASSALTQIKHTVFYDNYAGSYGGGLSVEVATVEITDCRFEANTVVYGGGAAMFSSNASATIARNTFTGNSASYGAAFHSDKASLTVYDNYVLNNLGGNALSLSGTVGHEVSLYNNIIAGNASTGIDLMRYTLNLYHNTIADNGDDGLVIAYDAHAVIINNIFSGHNSAGADSIRVGGTGVIDSSTNNLFWNNTNDPDTGSSPVVGDPKYVGTYHISSASAARDHGSGSIAFINWDIDHEARPKGNAPDIGADETQFVGITPILFLLQN